MASIDSARVATCVVAAALAGASAVVFPSVARGAEGDPGASLPVADLAAAAVATVDAGEAGTIDHGALGEVVAGALDSAATVAEPVAESSAPDPQPEATTTAATPDTATPGVTDGTTAAGSEPMQPGTASDGITDDPADTTVDTAAGAAPPPPGPRAGATAVQSAPSNLNVSIRVDSPGDNGPVTQLNVAAAVGGTRNEGAPPQPTAVAPAPAPVAGTGQSTPTASTAGAGATAVPASPSGTWEWQWDCLSPPAFSAISSGSSTNGSIPTNWTWIWNCGNNPGQYQTGTASQYQPENVNVSIRISSPGNDGAVSQSNVSVAIGSTRVSPDGHTPTSPAATQPAPDVPAASLPGFASGPDLSSLPGLSALPAVLSPIVSVAPSLVEGGDVSEFVVGAALPFVEDPLELPFVRQAPDASSAISIGGTAAIRIGELGAFPDGAWLAPHLDARLPVRGVGPTPQSVATESATASSSGSGGKRHVKPAPRWRTHVPAPSAPESVPSGTSAAAATGGGSSGGGLPVFLAIPFLAALLDLARRVALDRAASPSEHRSRMPDTPG